MKLTLCGDPGSGKSTIAKILCERLHVEYLTIGALRRQAAKDKGMTLEEFNVWSEQNPKEGDAYFDEYQVKVGKEKEQFLMDSRLAFHFIPDAIHIYLTVDRDEAVRRIWNDKSPRNEGKFASPADLKESLIKRVASDKKRYEALYPVRVYNLADFDIVIDTTHKTPLQVIDEIERRLTTA